MLLESYNINYVPLFVTLTFNPESYVDNRKTVIDYVQKFFKRLRKDKHDIRYFMAIERGEKRTKRLHVHMIIWSKSLYTYNLVYRSYYLWQKWSYGIVDVQEIRSAAGIYYVSKYIVKNLEDISTLDDFSNYDRHTKTAKKEGRVYTWSNKPALGTRGIKRWKYLINQDPRPYSITRLPPNYINIRFAKEYKKVYIPSYTYKKTCKSLGIDLSKLHVSDNQKNK